MRVAGDMLHVFSDRLIGAVHNGFFVEHLAWQEII